MSLRRVWEPLRIGRIEVPNRIARAANTTTISPSGIDAQFIAYHRARARGGVGLSILEAAAVHPSSQLSYAIDDATCRGYEELIRTVRPYGMRVFQQLWHGGHHLPGALGRLPWAPADVPSPFTGLVGLSMGSAEIEEMVAAFATAARRCRDTGIDGVEIHGGHGYLIQQFLSPLTNTRSDAYGGGFANRARFALELFRAVRAAVGPDFPVAVRLSTSTAVGNVTAQELGLLARQLQDEGLIDLLDTSHGDYYEMERMTGTMAEVAGYEIEPNRPLLAAVRIPRMITGRIRTLEEAETVLRAGDADLVSMVRAHIADPDIVRKTRAGRAEQVRPCIGCNQGCVGGLLTVARMGCVVNPAAGAESMLDESALQPAAVSRRVLVVGAGPAGLEAARVAALRGHRVVLAEAGAQPGGALLAAQAAPRMQGIADILDWLQREVLRLGVEIRTGAYLEAQDVLAAAADAVIVACGAVPRADGLQAMSRGEPPVGTAQSQVVSVDELLLGGRARRGVRRAVVYDDIGHYEAIAAAEALIDAGAAVIFVTSCPSFAPRLNGSSRNDAALKRLQRGSFQLRVGHQLLAIGAGDCTVRPLRSERPESLPADLVVLATHRAPQRALYDALRGRVPALQLVGDAASPRTLQDAIREGHLAALQI